MNIRFHQFGPSGHAQSVNSVDGNVVSNMAMLMNRVGSSDTWEREGSGVALWVSGYNIGQGNYPASQRHSGARTKGWTDGGRTKKTDADGSQARVVAGGGDGWRWPAGSAQAPRPRDSSSFLATQPQLSSCLSTSTLTSPGLNQCLWQGAPAHPQTPPSHTPLGRRWTRAGCCSGRCAPRSGSAAAAC